MITTELRLGIIDSTMEAARAAAGGQDFLFVTAEGQTRGKGTRGRSWKSPAGNVYMTVGINRRHVPPERLALLPLELGLLLWEEAASRLSPSSRRLLGLKWPNDLLFGGRKAGGMLVEGHGDMLLCGIGVNVAHAPEVADGGSPSACLADAGMADGEAASLAEGPYGRVAAAFGRPDFNPEAVLMAWQSKVDWELPHRLRDRPGMPWVKPVSVNRQGHLLVRHMDGGVETGASEWLVSDYLA
jgi:BirA family biotin operon repressor/biotin-[acetyl-CoA-carboxylase] ligase